MALCLQNLLKIKDWTYAYDHYKKYSVHKNPQVSVFAHKHVLLFWPVYKCEKIIVSELWRIYSSSRDQFFNPKSLPMWTQIADSIENFRFNQKFPICKIGPIGHPRQAVRNGQQNWMFAEVKKIADFKITCRIDV